MFRTAASLPVRTGVLSQILSRRKLSPADADRITAYVLSPACSADLVRLLQGGGLPSVPVYRKERGNEKDREVYLLPLRERVLLALLNRALHRYDRCFSEHLYSHIRGREPIYALTRIRGNPEFEKLWLLRTDIRNFSASMAPRPSVHYRGSILPSAALLTACWRIADTGWMAYCIQTDPR